MATPPSTPPRGSADKSVGELVFEVSERTSTLVREEIELAKAEIREKLMSLVRGGVAGIIAGTFAFLALILIMHGIAWLLDDLFFSDNIWAGFFIEAAFFLLLAGAGGLFAYRAMQRGAPPVPEQAIEEAKRTREMLEAGDRK